MFQSDPNHAKTLGADVRALRKARGMTIAALAETLGRSIGWVSQVERDLSSPSVNDLRYIAKALGVPMSMLFGHHSAPAEEAGLIVRKGARRPIGSNEGGLIEELLSPDLTDDFEVVHSTFEVGACLHDPVTRPTQEVGYIVSGKLDIEIDGRAFTVSAGDSFRTKGQPMRYSNPYETPAVAIWVIAPPIY